MGILETLPLEDEVALTLQPIYKQCIHDELVREDRMSPDHVKEFCTKLAEEFERVATKISGDSLNA